jgi:hypothetical protein
VEHGAVVRTFSRKSEKRMRRCCEINFMRIFANFRRKMALFSWTSEKG